MTIGYCVTGAPRATGAEEVVVPVTATYSAPGGSMQRSLELHFIAGEGVSRVLESLDLASLGLTRHAASHVGLLARSGARSRERC